VSPSARPARIAGFTLLELLLALSIVGVLLAIAFGGLRMGVVAWTRGEDRAETQQHDRGLSQILVRTIGSTYPFQGALGEAPERRWLFKGEERRVQLVTQDPPFPGSVRAAFTAVVITVEDEAQVRGLVIRQRILPNRDPFTQATVVLRDPSIQAVEFAYLNDQGSWVSSWDADEEKKLPSAIRLRVSTTRGDRVVQGPPITVSLHTLGDQNPSRRQ
jgi:general secretion pathway protein J